MAAAPKIGNVTAGLMVGTALLIDGVQFLLSLTILLLPFSLFLTFIAFIGFGLWFSLCGVSYMKGGGKKALTGAAAAIIELIPVVNALPATTAGVVLIIAQTRIEDARSSIGKTVTPRTVQAKARLERMRASRASRVDSAREQRDETQQARHAPANDNAPGAANDNTASREGSTTA